MFNMYSVLLIVVNACLLLLNANASPIRTTTVYDALQITPLPLAAESHPVNFLSLSSELCQDNVRSAGCEPPTKLPEKNEPEQQTKDHLVISSKLCKDNFRSAGCEPPARLTKRREPTEPTLLCGGKNCISIAGECVCHHLDPEWPRIWRYPSQTIGRRPTQTTGRRPSQTIGRRAEDKPNPIPSPTEIETSAAGHTVGHALPFIPGGPSRLSEEIEDKPNPIPSPTEIETSAAGHTVDHALFFILGGPSRLIEEIEDKPTPTPTQTASIKHPHDLAWLNILLLPTQNVPEVESKPASTPTPTELSSEEYRRILGVMANEAAVKAAEAHHTLSPRDNEEELRKCHKGRDCNKWHNTFPPPAQPGVVSKTDIGHPTLSHRDDEAEPTITQTSTPIQTPTPTTTMAPCDPLESECLNPYLYRCHPKEHDCFWDHLLHTTKEEPSPTQTAVMQECTENDRQCQGSLLPVPPRVLPRPPQDEKGLYKSPETPCGVHEQGCRND